MNKFLEVHIEGFRSVQKHTQPLDGLGIIALKGINTYTGGSNGAGKTLLPESIYWCLTGDVLRTDDGVNDVVNEEMKYVYVSLKILSGESRIFIERFRHHPRWGTGSRMSIDGVNVTPKVRDLASHSYGPDINLPDAVCLNAVFFGTNTPRFASTASDAQRKDLYSKLIGINYHSELEYTKKCLGIVDSELNHLSILEAQYKSKLSILEEQLKVEAAREFSYRTGRGERLEGLKKSLEDSQSRIQKNENSRAALVSRVNEASNLLEIKKSLLSERQSMLQKMEALVQEIRGKLDSIGTGVCSLCKRPFDNADHIKATREPLENLLKIKTLRLGEIRNEVESLETERRFLESSFMSIQKDLENQDSHLASLRATRDSLESQVRFLENETYDDSVKNSLLSQKEKVLKDLEKILQSKSDLQPLRKKLEFWVKGYSKDGILADILPLALPKINERLAQYIQVISEGSIHAEVVFSNGKPVIKAYGIATGKSYSKFSDGERRRVDIALYFANHDASMIRANGTNVLFIDEAVDHVDEIGVDAFLKLLNMKLNYVSTIFVTSHRKELVDSIPQKILAIKENKFSRYVYQEDDVPVAEI